MSARSTRSGVLPVDLLVVLADPRLPYPYHPSGAQEEHDRRDLARVTAALAEIAGAERVSYLDDHDGLLDALRNQSADLILNFCNAGFRNLPELQMHVPALLEMLGLPFAGADAPCLAICHDKAAVHGAAAAAGVPVPRQELLRLRRESPDLPRCYPALLKPNDGSGSTGITPASMVHDPSQAARRLCELARERSAPCWVVAEELLPGREFSMAILGPAGPGEGPACPAALEVDYSALPRDLPRIMTHDSKADENSVYWQAVTLQPADLPESVRREMERHCGLLFERLGCRDYARFDFRADDSGVLRLIDANAHPEWGSEGMMASMSGFSGMSYGDFLARIISAALHRLSQHAIPMDRADA